MLQLGIVFIQKKKKKKKKKKKRRDFPLIKYSKAGLTVIATSIKHTIKTDDSSENAVYAIVKLGRYFH